MSPDLERTLREVPRRFPRPDRGTTADALRELRETFERSPRPRRRHRWTIALVAVAVAALGTVAYGTQRGPSTPAGALFPVPLRGTATFMCPRFAPAFNVDLEAGNGAVGASASTPGGPISRQSGRVGYGSAQVGTAAIDRLCRRTGRTTAGRAAGFNDSYTMLPVHNETFVETKGWNCLVRGRVLVRFVPLLRGGTRVGTRMDMGIEGRRNLIARIVVRADKATIRTAPVCSRSGG